MNKKLYFLFLVFMLIGTVIFAQQTVIAKAPSMVITDPLTSNEANSIGGVYDKVLSDAKNMRILNQLVLNKGMGDYGFQARDWANIGKTLDLGEVLNVDWVVRLQMFKRAPSNRNETEIIVTAVLLNIQARQITYATPVVLNNVNQAQAKMEILVNEITQIVSGETGGLAQSGQSVYKTGDRGPAGGWVFYDKGRYSDGWRYLEVAPKSTETSVARGKYIERISGSSREIGSGKNNTALILQLTQDYQIIQAARNCVNLDINWFNDWFLPSQRELSWFPSHANNNFADFTISYYWSSSGSDESVQFMIAGKGMPDRNQSSYLVRAVRAF